MFKYNYSLKALNTFGIDVKASRFAAFSTLEGLKALLAQRSVNEPLLILGGGSNILFTHDFEGMVLQNQMEGVFLEKETDSHVYVKSGAGVVWHNLVMHCVDKAYYGIENMALIPGCVGAAPMQNIGAYGVELKDVFYSLEALNIQSGQMRLFTKDECKFGYRESVFKRELKNQYIITAVTLCLRKKPTYNVSYGNIQQQLETKGVKELTAQAIAQAVITIRQSKLPDPKEIGNAGSFFKNPEVSVEAYTKLKHAFPEIVAYATSDNKMKLAAGWLIEQAGWKGKTIDAYGVHKNQALVLVNYGGAQGHQILNLSQEIVDSVKAKFDVTLEREVNIY